MVDTNIFVSGLIVPEGLSRRLIELWLTGGFVLLTSPALRAEVTRILREGKAVKKYQVASEETEALIALVEVVSRWVRPHKTLPVTVRDPKDEMVLACALGGNADYIVTGDADLLVLNGEPQLGSLQIVTVRAFLESLAS